MAYRKLELTDRVRIAGNPQGQAFGSEGDVVDTTSSGAKVRYYITSHGRGSGRYVEQWFNQANLVILSNTPVRTRTTPVQALGYRVGQQFVVNDAAAGFALGAIVTLNVDDGTNAPLFKGPNARYTLADNYRSPGGFLSLHRVTPYIPEPAQKPEQEKEEVTQFKIGDRVKVIDDDGFDSRYVGRKGVIAEIDETHLPVRVDFDDDDYDWGRFTGLELVAAVAPATIKEKLDAIDRLTAEVRALLG
ncbi:hypothetical protein uav_041 [Pseudomonas phage UAVern]|uniref:Uncharacterized protein n=1 Tax=Pseudomonas phage UAVern TaxID=2856997 RepID=A0A975YYM3_9CAUD|nr:hypothetical protein uav_041 [Pseudomonas phage UAVern]